MAARPTEAKLEPRIQARCAEDSVGREDIKARHQERKAK